MIARIQVRRDTYANWYANNPTLANGEIGYDETTEKFKVGDNNTAWRDLPYELGQWKSDASGNLSFGNQTQTLGGDSHAGTPLAEGNVTIHNNLIVEGDFTVNGTTTTINTEEVTIEDNMVVLNSNLTGAPPLSLDSGIEVNLGTSGSQKFYWDQATLKWTLDADVNVLGDIYSNGTALWRLNSNDIYFTGGDVGIGTSTPAAKLHISTTNSVPTLSAGYNTSATGHVSVAMGHTTTASGIYSVAMGTLSVASGDYSTAIGREGTASGDYSTVMGYQTVASGNYSTAMGYDANVSGNYAIGMGHTIVASGYNSFAQGHATSATGSQSIAMGREMVVSGDNSFGIGLNNPASEHTLAQDNTFSIMGGKVGIGTTSPIYELHVREDQAATTNLALQNFTVDTSANAQIFIETKPSAGDPQIQFQIDGTEAYSVGIDNSDSDKFKISDSGTLGANDRLVIDSSGRVGLGTNGPSSKLHINGSSSVSVKITDSASSGTIETGLVLERSGANTDYRVLNNGTFRVQTATDASTWTDIMTITSAGNVDFLGDVTSNGSAVGVWTPSGNDIYYTTGEVGIGTTSPSAILNVAIPNNKTVGTLYTSTRDYNDSSNRVDLLFQYKYNSSNQYATGSQISLSKESTADGNYGSDIRLLTRENGQTTSEKMRIKGDGKVGIGTDDPDGRLHVKSSGNGAENIAAFGNANINSGLYVRTDDGNLEWGLATLNQRDLIFETDQTRRMTIDGATGKVGVGTSDPDELLHLADTSAGSNPGIRIENDDQEWVIYNRGSSSDRFQIFDVDNSKTAFRILPNSPTNAISINTTGVAMGKESASEVLDVVGNITATGTITSSSDITLKENIELISDPIEKVKEISGYTFNKKGEDLRLVGLIAQEVEKVLPEAVAQNNEGLKSVAYGNLVALLVECVKKQDERIDQLEETIKKLK